MANPATKATCDICRREVATYVAATKPPATLAAPPRRPDGAPVPRRPAMRTWLVTLTHDVEPGEITLTLAPVPTQTTGPQQDGPEPEADSANAEPGTALPVISRDAISDKPT